jgi:hypothetical protein
MAADTPILLDESERLNGTVRAYEEAAPWEHRELAATLHSWHDLFNEAFFLSALPPAFLRLDRARCTTLGSYRSGRNGVGAVHDLGLNTLYLDRPLYHALAALLHEMVHQWQALHGHPGRSRQYHNQEFLAKCEAVGIPSLKSGCGVAVYGNPFLAMPREGGVDLGPGVPRPLGVRRGQGRSTLKKWSCGCTNVRAAVVLEVQCLRCGQRFHPSD